jgi:hypothetical protein
MKPAGSTSSLASLGAGDGAAPGRKAAVDRKRLRTCSTSCPDLSNPEAGVFSKYLPASSAAASAILSNFPAAIHRSVSSSMVESGGLAGGNAGMYSRTMSFPYVSSSEALGSLYEDEEGDDEAQLRAKKYGTSVCRPCRPFTDHCTRLGHILCEYYCGLQS